ncbi:TPA: hypothetical protein I7280_23645 [Vibrio parahaemolyticus]|nr:hypothetical protein [Vibrio parahaemolyticus]
MRQHRYCVLHPLTGRYVLQRGEVHQVKVFERPIVYFIQGELTKRIKIGSTQWLIDERMRHLQTGSPDELVFIGAYFGTDFTETELHTLFASTRVHGEWFEPSHEIEHFVSEHCVTDLGSHFYTFQQIQDGTLSLEQAIRLGPKQLAKRYEKHLANIAASISF